MMHIPDNLHHLLSGIIAVPATPFNDRNIIDESSLRRYTRVILDYGVCGILVPALAAEVYQLSNHERLQTIHIILDEVQGKIPVIGSATADNSEDRLRAVEELNQTGCDGILVFIPFSGERQYKKEIIAISRHIDRFLMLQDWDFQGFGVPVPVIAELFDMIPSFKSLKIEVAFAGRKYTEVLEACNNKIHVAGGWASNQMIEGLDRGVHAYMPSVLHHIYKKIFDLYKHGDRSAAVELFNRILPVLAFTRQHPDISIHFNKRLLYRQGIFSTYHVRKSDIQFDRYHARITEELIELALNLSNNVLKT